MWRHEGEERCKRAGGAVDIIDWHEEGKFDLKLSKELARWKGEMGTQRKTKERGKQTRRGIGNDFGERLLLGSNAVGKRCWRHESRRERESFFIQYLGLAGDSGAKKAEERGEKAGWR